MIPSCKLDNDSDFKGDHNTILQGKKTNYSQLKSRKMFLLFRQNWISYIENIKSFKTYFIN